eukprot:TRINITY_DN35551_c0_g1_i1.p1 TRINITY_DN35551_c0_g1~~TRINITY_DN35551_c0_g1_i1.p1  ORF type:complete len:273 (-),score=12.72 TRINITY_DN35551_c0_g1_i1:238-1056(-)
MARRVSAYLLQLPGSLTAMWPTLSKANVCAIGAIVDTVVALILMSYLDTLELRLAAAAQPFFSCISAMVAIAYILDRPWFTSVKWSAIISCFAMSTFTLAMGFAISALLVIPTLDLGDDDKVHGKILIVGVYSTINAFVSFLMCVVSALLHETRGASAPLPSALLTLKDVTLDTFVLQEAGATVGGLVDVKCADSCCVCLCPMFLGDTVSKLTCGHQYHTSCLENWQAYLIKREKSMFCPLRCDLSSAVRPEGHGRGCARSSSEHIVCEHIV